MTESIDLSHKQMLALTRASLMSLRSALLRGGDPQAAVALQEAGYAGGDALNTAFRGWLAGRADQAAEALDVERFAALLSEFFRETGWGTLHVGTIDDVVATLDTPDWGEAQPDERAEHPACHITTGIFADLFGRLAGAPVAVLEVECRSAGHARCRFLVGSPAVMDAVYEAMGRGAGYEAAVRAAA